MFLAVHSTATSSTSTASLQGRLGVGIIYLSSLGQEIGPPVYEASDADTVGRISHSP